MIAVVIPVHNGADWIGDALESVRAQGPLVTEIVVVNDGSTDRTNSVLAIQPDITTLYNTAAQGPGAARNRGVAASSAPFITFLDADDLFVPGALDLRMSAMRGGDFDVVATAVHRRPMESPSDPPETGQGWWTFLFGASLLTRDAWKCVGPIDETLQRGEDVEWWVRARASSVRIARSERVTLIVRTHDDSWSARLEQRTASTFDVIRRRLAGP
jgi:glycosyltransferase involved in cell wall biosynthesis